MIKTLLITTTHEDNMFEKLKNKVQNLSKKQIIAAVIVAAGVATGTVSVTSPESAMAVYNTVLNFLG